MTAQLFQTDEAALRFVFLDKDTGLYLAGFALIERAAAYGKMVGYVETAEPEKISMREIADMQPIEANMFAPANARVADGNTAPRPPGIRRGLQRPIGIAS